MTLVFIARLASSRATRRITQQLLTHQSNSSSSISSTKTNGLKSINSSISRSIHGGGNNNKSTINRRQGSKYNKLREFNIALASGVLLIASYVSLSNHYLSDSGDNLIRSFSNQTNSRRLNNDHTNSNNTNSNKQNIYLLNDEEITKKLRNLEESYFVQRGQGVLRYDISQLPSNNPIEDDRSESIITVPFKENEDSDFYFWGIYDGHSGYYTSGKLKDELINYVVNELSSIYKVDPKNENLRLRSTDEIIDDAIKRGFLKLDHEIVEKSLFNLVKNPNVKDNVINALPASSGSCGILTFYDSFNKNLKVAVTGDSRALLGSLNDSNEWTVKSLSIDQTGDNPDEIERILKEHPESESSTAIRNGRVLGSLQPTRAFGDFRYKLKEINGFKLDQLPDHLKLYFRSSPRNLLTPPYVTAEPEITTHVINPSKNDFMVLGSDGLFELLSNEEIIGLVVKWLEKNPINNSSITNGTNIKLTDSKDKSEQSKWSNYFKDDKKLPKVLDISPDSIKQSQRPPFRNIKNNEQHEYFLEDSNVSTHLIRNALSLGGSKEYVSTLVSIPSPTSRKYRDDLTVTVVFFGNQLDNNNINGNVEINGPATRNGDVTTNSPKL
ncbi:hypothetical protein WICMUC_000274 [Wickerhamomyces mucosus]|uniref:PPM-type phosphatase domain-containing protein n=1 Tax=Wickerhamomyces mucosus TaxID=1378264 RepID=A0A9P8PZL9_9ASCO|nr:hypothetical protein WICMUC_000274 [Wickerhamomyces mucosus]